MKYTAINIGPIISTLGMARKPRELWAASYLFSYLMKNILAALDKDSIISPDTINQDEKNGIGLYPDRAFIKGEVTYDDIKGAIADVATKLGIDESFFNVMLASGDYDKDSLAIKDLNKQLDRLELFNIGSNTESVDIVRQLIKPENADGLIWDAFNKVSFTIETLGEIAAVELKNEKDWDSFKKAIRSKNEKEQEKAYRYLPKDKLKSYHKYFCIVQADGDNMGKAVTHSGLAEGKVKIISEALLKFGKDADAAIKEYGGFPVYAGGDDLLFIAPVVGKNHTNIFELLTKLDTKAFDKVKKAVDDCHLKEEDGDNKGKDIHASLSFGVSVNYYKYPLYEALESARKQLFEKAKKVDGKNAIAVDWRKHSGGAFYMEYSCHNAELKGAFENLIKASEVEETVVSAIGHKIRESEGLFKLWIEQSEASSRNKYFFVKYLDYTPDKKDEKITPSDIYKEKTLALLNKLLPVYKDYKAKENEEKKEQKLTKTMYAMLRIAKFIKGEEVKDE